MKKYFIVWSLLFLGLYPLFSSADDAKKSFDFKLKWSVTRQGSISGDENTPLLIFEGARFDPEIGIIPLFRENFNLSGHPSGINVKILQAMYAPLEEENLIPAGFKIPTEITPEAQIGFEKRKAFGMVSFVPIRKNPLSGKVEKLVSFTLGIEANTDEPQKKMGSRIYADHSVLATGNWYKIGIKKEGVYKINASFLKKIGMDVDKLDPRNIRLYGNGGKMLPFLNAAPRTDDLRELAIRVVGEEDGIMNDNDYILFYGESTDDWNWNPSDGLFKHKLNLNTDTNSFFITADLGPGKRISSKASSVLSPTKTVNTFNNFYFHESEFYNFIKSGREWYGEKFDLSTTQNFSLSFPNMDLSSPVNFLSEVAGRSDVVNAFSVSVNGNTFTQNINPIDLSTATGDYAGVSLTIQSLSPGSSSLQISYTYNKPRPTAIGWLNKFEINLRQQLSMSADQLAFRDVASLGSGNIAEFTLSNAYANTQIWDVSNPALVQIQETNFSGNQIIFKAESDILHEYIAFNDLNFPSPFPIGMTPNQDLHGLSQADFIIVTPPAFISEADILANFHRNQSHLSVHVVTTNQIYNEFSGGLQDVTAIRDFTKMFYDRSSIKGGAPKHLLLFGDGSYDSKDYLGYHSNYIPTYQSANSITLASSFVSDDFFGLLDDNEGSMNFSELIDVNVGRMPIQNISEAKAMVDKIIHYGSPAEAGNGMQCIKSGGTVFGDWRNVLCFVADDKDGNTHLQQTESLTNFLDTAYREYNIDKIYFDSYNMESTPGGQRYPDVKEALSKRVEKGALIVNYVGHGGEVGWAHERVLEVSDIQNWKNDNNLPLFVTATCEFSRFDDPSRTSAGELVLLNPKGGGIGLLTTVRIAFSGTNGVINQKFYTSAFKPNADGSMPSMGEVFTRTKNAAMNNRNFTLLGDPALTLAYPQLRIETSTINGKAPGSGADTLKALDKITITGFVKDPSGNKMTSFNGILYPTVFDKFSVITTLRNDPASAKTSFKFRKNMLFKGKASIKNGEFSFTFIVPNDINYSFGLGKISYYAENGMIDANGMTNPMVGGASSKNSKDETGPEVHLYMNDDKFVFGGITDESPSLYAVISDPSGINTVGNGIGHDIKAVIDNENKDLNLNDYYEADLDNYQKGKVIYPFSKLSQGTHKLRIKAWDVYNNSAEANTEFIVSPSAQFALKHVLNYPNPFTTHTQFYFEHNRPCNSLDVQVQVFTVSGRLVKTIETQMRTEGYRSEAIDWDGRDDYGNKIGRGVYVYRVKVRSMDGSYADKFEKLVILN